MASEEALRSTNEKANFQRLTRLLMRGGVTLLRELFDSIYPPSHLPTKLSDPTVQTQLRGARLTRPEWNCLYPSPGVYGKSTDFDITLIFRLLRTICSLAPPPTGWDNLPNNTDRSLEADLARVKYYRNEVYGHNKTMEVTDAEFVVYWREIGEALLRIAANISHRKRVEWKKAIDQFLCDPLTPEEERFVEELHQWYKQDIDVKDELEKLGATCQDGITTLNENIQGCHKGLLQEFYALREDVKQYKIVQDSDRTDPLQQTLKATEDQNSLIEEQITEQFRQLRRLSVDLQNAFLQLKITTAHNLKQLEELETKRKNRVKSSIRHLAGVSVAGMFWLAGHIVTPFAAGFSLVGSVVNMLVMTSWCLTGEWDLLNGTLHKELQSLIAKAQEATTQCQLRLKDLIYFTFQLAEFFKPLHADLMLLRLLEVSGFEFLRGRIILGDGATSAATVSVLEENIRQNYERIMNNLEPPNVGEIKGLVESFIDFIFTMVYNKTNSDKQIENHVGEVEDDDFDDDVQYVNETSIATAEKQRLFPV